MRRVWLLYLASAALAGAADLRVVEAAKSGNREAVRALLKDKAAVNAAEADGMTALHWAVQSNDLEMARALASGPRLLLLDEPAAGANPYESTVLAQLIREIRDSGVTVVLIEHDMSVVMGLSDGVTVLDHANGIATLAAQGNAAKAHFIREAWRDGAKVYTESSKLTPIPGYNPQMAADEAWTLQKVAAKYNWNPPGMKVAAKTGTWENGQPQYKGQNAHSWTVGYTPSVRGDKNPAKNWNGLAVAVWVGNKDKELPIKMKDGKTSMQGSSGAGQIFGAFIKAATKGKPIGKFPGPSFVGDEDAGDASSPPPSQDPNDQNQPGGPGGPGVSTGPGGGGGGGNNGRPSRPGRG